MSVEQVISSIENYTPFNDQERADKPIILDYLRTCPDIFFRTNLKAHMTASAWVVNKSFSKVLMVYHNIYNSWSWTGGHSDGDTDLLSVSIREAKEETGVSATAVSKEIFSIEQLTVDSHYKRGIYVPSHIHLNVSYLLMADEKEELKVKEDENRAVSWFFLNEALKATSPQEEWITKNIYTKLNCKLSQFKH